MYKYTFNVVYIIEGLVKNFIFMASYLLISLLAQPEEPQLRRVACRDLVKEDARQLANLISEHNQIFINV